MEQRKSKWRTGDHARVTEQLLASNYSQLLKWGLVLTRGDVGKAEETVQEFCLYWALTKPDLSEVTNLDGYLYTCLRHIYLSGLARSSREAMHFVSVADFDCFESALADNRSSDSLQKQNDLRRICGYAVWRKESSKSASYFILHFFHSYSRRETAQFAQLPIAAIYNKLKIARSEIKSYLDEPGKLRIVNQNLPPAPSLAWSLLSAPEFFKELREIILSARLSEFISEQELLAQYSSLIARPIECALLAHIVSCDRCLEIIDRYFRRPTLRDREPLDGFDSASEARDTCVDESEDIDRKVMLRSIRRRWGMIHEHRPDTLSIAVDGRIIAFHDVQAEYSTLSARIEHPGKAQFIEVFSEQDVRFALLSVGDLPPEGSYVRTQRVSLSDSRWLELSLTFDGLGLNSQVAYHDPALANEPAAAPEEPAEAWLPAFNDPNPAVRGMFARMTNTFTSFFGPTMPSSAVAWAFVLVIVFCAAGYLAYRHTIAPMSASEVLNQSVRIESASLEGQTEHQVVRFEVVSSESRVLQEGTVDLWKDGDGSRYLRRLYDSDHRLIAATWRNKNGEHSSNKNRRDRETPGSHHLAPMSNLWDQDLSAHAFSMLRAKESQIHAIEDGYEVTTVGPVEGHPQLISATLVLDRHYLPIRETLRVQAGLEIHEVRLVRASYERKPSSSIPDTIFNPENELHSSRNPNPSDPQPDAPSNAIEANVQLSRLQIAVLYRLNSLGSDTGEPIEVIRTPEGHIRVSGTVGDASLEQQITADLERLQDHQLLDLRLVSSRDVKVSGLRKTITQDTSVYEIGQIKPPADEILRKYFQSKGISADQLNSTVEEYSHDVLQHAQRALQHAYALNRLGSALSTAELSSIGTASQQQWVEMVYKHAEDLESQLHELRAQLAQLAQPSEDVPDTRTASVIIENPDQFNRAAIELLRQTQDLNSDAGRLFSSNGSGTRQPDQDSSLRSMMNAIPLGQAEGIARFAMELNTAQQSGLNHRHIPE
jgi:DNA-directed RNA polymerase specialized sigma24 family protein